MGSGPTMRTLMTAAFLLGSLAGAAEAGAWTEQDKLTASDAAGGDFLGYSVSIDGDYAIAGAYGDDDKGSESGSAYIFKRSGTDWSEQDKLLATDGAGGDNFGECVSISGDYAIVGAALDVDDNGDSLGSAYVFERSGETWAHQPKLLAPDAADGDHFGSAVSINGDDAIIGASGDDSSTKTNAGSAYVFHRSETGWSYQAKLIANDPDTSDYFGRAVSISGDYTIVGVESDDDNGTSSGSAYIFKRSGTTWSQQDKLTADDATGGDHFGFSVSIDGDYALVGAYWDDHSGKNYAGSAYIFHRDDTDWTQQDQLFASDAAENDWFGCSVSISGDYALVGSLGDSDGGSQSGSAYVFKRSGSSWNEIDKLTADDADAYDNFGFSVALDGGYAMVGAPYDDDAGGLSGSAYIFVPEPSTTVMLVFAGAALLASARRRSS